MVINNVPYVSKLIIISSQSIYHFLSYGFCLNHWVFSVLTALIRFYYLLQETIGLEMTVLSRWDLNHFLGTKKENLLVTKLVVGDLQVIKLINIVLWSMSISHFLKLSYLSVFWIAICSRHIRKTVFTNNWIYFSAGHMFLPQRLLATLCDSPALLQLLLRICDSNIHCLFWVESETWNARNINTL